MGLTIHYSIRSTAKSDERARQLLAQMRERARDLPFEKVGEVIDVAGDQCDVERQRGVVDESRRWLLIQSGMYVNCPWNKRLSRSVPASQFIAFETIPGPGSEPANIGLCRYPGRIDWEYRPRDDRRFQERSSRRSHGQPRFSWKKWSRWLSEHGHDPCSDPDDQRFVEVRQVKTGQSGWRWSSFCKTQYASDPACGGTANFLRCHISVITLLERIGELPTVKVQIKDEGSYGPSYYSDDWREASAQGRKPTYVRHPGKYSPKALAAEVGEWNGMIAAFAGAIKDATHKTGIEAQAPIYDFPNFEELEFCGSRDEQVQPFLRLMQGLAESSQAVKP